MKVLNFNAGARTGVAYSLEEFVAIVTGCNGV